MSDNIRRFTAIFDALKQNYPGVPKGNLRRHLVTLAALINGIVASNSTQLIKIAEHQVVATKNESRIMAYRRWLQNENINYQLFFLPFLSKLLTAFAQQTLYLAIDGSVVGRGCVCLMLSLIYKKRALPLTWLVVKQKKGHLPEDIHLRLIQTAQAVLPVGQKVVLVGDGEFDGLNFQQLATAFGWQYALRTAHNRLLWENGDLFNFNQVLPMANTDVFFLPQVQLAQPQYGPVQAVMWWKKTYHEPIFLLTNMELAYEACACYKKRFKIETFFSDQKSRGFHLHKSHLSDPERLNRLLFATCLAYIWIIFLGTLAFKEQWYRQIHRTDRCDWSLFSMGLHLLHHFINYGLPILIDFGVCKFKDPFKSKSVR